MTHHLVFHSWAVGGLSVDAPSPSLSPCAPASGSVESDGADLWNANGNA